MDKPFERKKVLHIVSGLSGGGVAAVIMSYYSLLDKDFVFDFATNGLDYGFYKDVIINKGGQINYIPPMRNGFWAYFQAITKLIWKDRKSILHCHLGEKSIIILFLGTIFGVKKRILHIHSSIKPETWRESIIRRFLTYLCELLSTQYFACGEESAKWFYGEKLFFEGKVFIMRNAINLNRYHFSEKIREIYRKKYNLQDNLVIGNIGRFSLPKNHMFLLEIFTIILRKRQNSVLLLIGGGELEGSIMKRVTELGISKNVIFIGVIDNVNELINCLDLLILPSFSEGVPLAAIEALANDLTVICSDVITKEIFIESRIFYLSLSQSAEYWANYIINCDNARKSVFTELKTLGFDIESQAEHLKLEYLSKI